MRTSSDVFDAINMLERHFPVREWRADDIDLWPLYRFRLYGNAMNSVLLNDAAMGRYQRLRGLAGRASRALLRVPFAALCDRGRNAAIRPGTAAVFFSDGVSFVRLGATWFDRVMDPVMQALEERGYHSLKLTPLSEAHIPRYVPSRFVQPTIDRIKLMAWRSKFDVTSPEFEAFYAAARDLFGDFAPSLKWLHLQAARLDALANWFARLFERSAAGHAFVNTYYSLEGLAFVQAAQRMGLHSIDLQHGIQGPHHVAYARWVSPPARGYSTLPHEFWVWGEEERATIEAWRSGCTTHAPRVTGNFWLQRWRDDTDPLVTRYVEQARALRRSRPQVTQVLACLTWGVPEEETTKLIEAAKLCGPSVAWWWRLHPVYAHESARFARLLERHGLDGREVAEATYAPLYALLRAADVALAHSSTVIQEAVDLGVPSVVTSDYGAELHRDLVRRGMALHANDASSIAEAVRVLAARPASATAPVAADRNSLGAVLDAAFPRPSRSLQRQNVLA